MAQVLYWNFILLLSQTTSLIFKRMIAIMLLKFSDPKPLSLEIRGLTSNYYLKR